MSWEMRITGLAETEQALRDLGNRKKQTIRTALSQASFAVERSIKEEIRGPAADETRLNRDTGMLSRSLKHEIEMGPVENKSTIGFPVGQMTKIAATHESGATIVPVRAKMLKIKYPWRRASARGGRKGARAMSSIGGGKTFFKDGFMFTTRVQIPPRPFMDKSLRRVSGQVQSIFERAIGSLVELRYRGR